MSSPNGEPWYSQNSKDLDVIISSKVTVSRNLANFPFTDSFKLDDAERVQSLIFDAFSQFQQKNEDILFHAIVSSELDGEGRKLLEERGVFKPESTNKKEQETAVIMSLDGQTSCTVNYKDHLRLSTYRNGLSVRKCFETALKIDEGLQSFLQFAASYDFGYLNHSFRDCGSGLKLSARIHIPGIVKTGHLSDVVSYLESYKYKIKPVYNENNTGVFYQVSTASCMKGSELDQLAEFEGVCKFIAESERKISREYADNKKTIVRNSVIRSYSLAKSSLLVPYREAVSLISEIKFARDYGFLSGIEDSQLCGLLYRIQPAHLSFLLKDGNFQFEKDISGDKGAMIDRLRALILQEAFEKISLGNI